MKKSLFILLTLSLTKLTFSCSGGLFSTGSKSTSNGNGDAKPTAGGTNSGVNGGASNGGGTAGGTGGATAGGTATAGTGGATAGGTATAGTATGGTPGSGLPDVTLGSGSGTLTLKVCSAPLSVQGRWNPYLAGTSQSINYNAGAKCVDTAAANGPPAVPLSSADCLLPGSKFYFNISGTIDHGGAASNADGVTSDVESHALGSKFGKSNMSSPLNAMVGVFLEADAPDLKTPPAVLSFSSATSRDQLELHPELRQVFFIGDGKTSSGQYQKIVVPNGATRFYFAVWDSFEWCDNSGSLSGQVYWQAP